MARLWDTNMADRAAAIEQATKLGGVVVRPPKRTGFDGGPGPDLRPPMSPRHDMSHPPLPGEPDEPF